MITLENVCYSYRRGKVDALHGVSCHVGSGIHLLMGENGAGKTTMLHIMAGLRYPVSGQCCIDGSQLRLRRPSDICRVQMFSGDMKLPAESIAEMERIHAPFFPNFDAAMLRRNLDAFGIGAGERLRAMSYGTYVKAAIAYMFALRCDVLLLDEPANGLDPLARKLMRRMLVECVGPEQTVVVSTNSITDFELVYDNVMVLSHGRLLLHESVAAIAARLAFVTSSHPLPEALYSELGAGLWRSIVPNVAGEESQPDMALLYEALAGDTRREILNILTKNTYENNR